MKKGILAIALVASAGAVANAQVIDVGGHDSGYTGFTRGFSYVAPVGHTITNLELPGDVFATGDLASYVIDVNGVNMVYSMGNAGGIAVSVDVHAGDEVLIIGNWTTGAGGSFTAKNSYNGTSPYATSILGNAVDLFRGGYQSDIADGTYTGGAGFTGLTGSHGRIFVTVTPAPASLALLGLGGLVAVRRRR